MAARPLQKVADNLVRFDWARDVLVRDLERELPKLVNGLSHDPVNAEILTTVLALRHHHDV